MSRLRTLMPRLALILAFGSVLLLIAEIDRPLKTIMETSQQAMIGLRASITNTKN